MEGRELNAVPVYFADVEVFAHRRDVLGWDVVCGAPDAICGFVLHGRFSVQELHRKKAEEGHGE